MAQKFGTKIDLAKISEKASSNEGNITKTLLQLEKDEVITLNLAKTDAQVTFIEPREDDKTINRIATVVEQQNDLKQVQVNAVLDYIKNDAVCKSVQLLSYFGETNIDPCGICSVCTKTKKPAKSQDLKVLRNLIIELLENGDLSSRVMITELDCSENDLKKVLQLLLEHQIISITKTNTYKLFHK